jgi:hypothetical protein
MAAIPFTGDGGDLNSFLMEGGFVFAEGVRCATPPPRHCRAVPGPPRLSLRGKAWMPGTRVYPWAGRRPDPRAGHDELRFIACPSAIVPAPAFFHAPGHSSITALASFKSEGAGAPLQRIGPSVCPSFERRALRSAPARRFLGMGRAFREAKASPSASSSRRLVVAGGGAPCRPGSAAAGRARGRRSRSPPSTPAGRPSWIGTAPR